MVGKTILKNATVEHNQKLVRLEINGRLGSYGSLGSLIIELGHGNVRYDKSYRHDESLLNEIWWFDIRAARWIDHSSIAVNCKGYHFRNHHYRISDKFIIFSKNLPIVLQGFAILVPAFSRIYGKNLLAFNSFVARLIK